MPAIPAPTIHTSADAFCANGENSGITKSDSHGDTVFPESLFISLCLFLRQRSWGFVKSEPKEQRNRGNYGVEPRISHVVRNEAEDRTISHDEAKYGYESINYPKNPEEDLRSVAAG